MRLARLALVLALATATLTGVASATPSDSGVCYTIPAVVLVGSPMTVTATGLPKKKHFTIRVDDVDYYTTGDTASDGIGSLTVAVDPPLTPGTGYVTLSDARDKATVYAVCSFTVT